MIRNGVNPYHGYFDEKEGMFQKNDHTPELFADFQDMRNAEWNVYGHVLGFKKRANECYRTTEDDEPMRQAWTAGRHEASSSSGYRR